MLPNNINNSNAQYISIHKYSQYPEYCFTHLDQHKTLKFIYGAVARGIRDGNKLKKVFENINQHLICEPLQLHSNDRQHIVNVWQRYLSFFEHYFFFNLRYPPQ